MPRNIIVYASRSELCRKLLIAMENCGILNLFDKIDVCRQGARIPQGLTDIPTLIVTTCDMPLVGQKAFEWVEQRRTLIQQHTNMKKMISNNIYQWNMLKSNITTNASKMLGYSDMEMGKLTDDYALVKDDATNNVSLPQSFVNWNESITIYTGPEEKKLTKDQQNMLLKNVEARRLEQDGIFKSDSVNTLNQLTKGNILPSQLSGTKLLDEKTNQPQMNPQMNPQMINPQMMNPQMMNPQMMNPQMINPQMMNPQMMNPQMMNPQMMNPQMMNPQMMNSQMNPQMNPQMMNMQLNQQMNRRMRN